MFQRLELEWLLIIVPYVVSIISNQQSIILTNLNMAVLVQIILENQNVYMRTEQKLKEWFY